MHSATLTWDVCRERRPVGLLAELLMLPLAPAAQLKLFVWLFYYVKSLLGSVLCVCKRSRAGDQSVEKSKERTSA